jgi:hypothetical protein
MKMTVFVIVMMTSTNVADHSSKNHKQELRNVPETLRNSTCGKRMPSLSPSLPTTKDPLTQNQAAPSQFMDTNARATDAFTNEITAFGNVGNGGGGSDQGYDGGYDTGPGNQEPDDGPSDEECGGSQGGWDGESEHTDEDDLHGRDKRSGACRRIEESRLRED